MPGRLYPDHQDRTDRQERTDHQERIGHQDRIDHQDRLYGQPASKRQRHGALDHDFKQEPDEFLEALNQAFH